MVKEVIEFDIPVQDGKMVASPLDMIELDWAMTSKPESGVEREVIFKDNK